MLRRKEEKEKRGTSRSNKGLRPLRSCSSEPLYTKCNGEDITWMYLLEKLFVHF